MEPVSLIVGALAAGAVSGATKGLSESASAAAGRAWKRLHAAIASAFAGLPAAQQALTEFEGNPNGSSEPLAVAIRDTGVDHDDAVIALAKQVLDLAGSRLKDGPAHSLDLRGAQGVQIGPGGTQTNTFN